ncbi:MAG TPA: F0F1 ATP synthase subunit A [Bacteroidales bacterium]|nr:F0F1 ATP synthase subunit A [Bacteroidales bacterium]
MQKLIFIFTLVFAGFSGLSAYAGSDHGHDKNKTEQNEGIDITQVIFDHILDAHDWHVMTLNEGETNEKHVVVPLPVILWDEGRLVFFMSSRLHHAEHSEYQLGTKDNFNGEYEGKIVRVNHDGQVASVPLDFSITKNVAALIFSASLLLLIFIPVARSYKKAGNAAPKGLQGFMEPLILFVVDDIVKPNIGEKRYERYVPYLLTLFFFILINNLMGLIPFFPFGANLTGNLAVTLTLAFFTLIIVNVSGNKGYWKHVFAAPGVPVWLLPIMIPVELIGIISKPFALMVRLFANITAGHIIVLSLISLIFIFQNLGIAPVSVVFVLFMDVLELLVAALQAYIFTLLTSLFIGLAVQEAEHH